MARRTYRGDDVRGVLLHPRARARPSAGAITAYAIGLGGYIAGAEVQSQGAVDAIRYSAGFVPAVCIIIAIAIMARYPLTESTFHTMVGEIAERRAAASTAEDSRA